MNNLMKIHDMYDEEAVKDKVERNLKGFIDEFLQQDQKNYKPGSKTGRRSSGKQQPREAASSESSRGSEVRSAKDARESERNLRAAGRRGADHNRPYQGNGNVYDNDNQAPGPKGPSTQPYNSLSNLKTSQSATSLPEIDKKYQSRGDSGLRDAGLQPSASRESRLSQRNKTTLDKYANDGGAASNGSSAPRQYGGAHNYVKKRRS